MAEPTPQPAKDATSDKAPAAPVEASATAPGSGIDDVNPQDFAGEVLSTNELPAQETLAKIAKYVILDKHGKTHTFESLYNRRHSARRVLVIFVRHFFCGNCQDYLRTLSASITPDALLRLPISTFITVIGCGDPGLIDMYASETGCPFPIYVDPTRKLYEELGMVRTLALGEKPAYIKKSILHGAISSIFQGLKQIKTGLVLKAGNQRQIGGEFLFEPLDIMTPIEEFNKQLGASTSIIGGSAPANAGDEASGADKPHVLDGAGGGDDDDIAEEKRVTWCHRMKSTRDHAEIPELMEILGLDGQGQPIKNKQRWIRAIETRKGTGLSMARQMNEMIGQAGGT